MKSYPMGREKQVQKGGINIKDRISELQNILSKIEHYLAQVPEGSLKFQKRQGKTYYYHQHKNPQNNSYIKTYIDRKNEKLAQKLAQKGYYSKVKPYIESQLHALIQFRKIYDYNDKEMDDIYDMLAEERKRLVIPVKVSVREKIRNWEKESYEPYQKYQENLKYETDNGELVRSKSEVIIANILAKHKEHLLYKYECPLEMMISGQMQIIHPDFTIMNVHTGKVTYWEHAGRMDDSRYASGFVQKMNTYMENKLFPGDDVIVTYETMNCPLNIHNVKMIVGRLIE